MTASSARQAAIDILQAEHQALTGVLEVLQHLLRDISAGHTAADFELLAAALYYIDDFSGRCHHPKEERHLFPAFRQHAPQTLAAVNALASEHQSDETYVRGLHRHFVQYQAGAPGALERFRAVVDIYASMLRAHMHKEEALMAEGAQLIPEAAWAAIRVGFTADGDPLFGVTPQRELARLRERITNLLPRKMRVQGGSQKGPAAP